MSRGRLKGTTTHSLFGGVGRVPAQNGGQHKTALGATERGKWHDVKCPKCGGPFWVKTEFLVRMRGANKKSCRGCRTKSRLEGLNAALAVAERKKKMGIRW